MPAATAMVLSGISVTRRSKKRNFMLGFFVCMYVRGERERGEKMIKCGFIFCWQQQGRRRHLY